MTKICGRTFINDSVGIICICVMYLALFYADYVVVKWVILDRLQESLWAPLHTLLFNSLALLLAISHLKASFSDPGVVPLPQSRVDFSDMHTEGQENKFDDDKKNWTVCRVCETYRPPKANHCFVCNRCVKGMDHHCPWINNCIGERNHKYFLQFLIYVGVLALYAIVLVIFSWILECPETEGDNAAKLSRFLHCMILFMESAVFGMFVIVALVDQFEQVLRVQGTNEPNNHIKRNSSKFYTLLSHVYGADHPITTLLSCGNRAKYRKDAYLIEHDV